MLTARDTILNKVAGFNAGADDYLVKPFSLVELESRIKALIRRNQNEHFNHTIMVGKLSLNSEEHTITREDKSLKLTPTGFKILEILMNASPRVVSKNELEEKVWSDDIPSSDALRTHMHSVRAQVDKPFANPMIMTFPGVGYQVVDSDKLQNLLTDFS